MVAEGPQATDCWLLVVPKYGGGGKVWGLCKVLIPFEGAPLMTSSPPKGPIS